ncbi:nose resistant to fluoxetine protein 6-like [Neocloeon triangulifer]|uniref:nose resistant to fluoxetine protein 6-like n=1 Tax=Neocloeon triangulifer TaxID=2078957 RepID=UPI00286F9B4C|nr:nose resistant to fluoxetine protein 6-like [Neocloeon triangulifer]
MQLLYGIIFLMIAKWSKADCDSDIQAYTQGLSRAEEWALEMLDSSVKYPQAGMFEGTLLVQLGNYDQCLSLRGPEDTPGVPRFKGQYCHFNYGFQSPEVEILNETYEEAISSRKALDRMTRPRRNSKSVAPVVLPFLWGVCAPSSCGSEGVKKVADFNVNFFTGIFNVEPRTSIVPGSCYYEGDGSKTLEASSWAFIACFGLLLIWIVISTVYEYLRPNMDALGWKILIKSFSLQTNLGDLVKLPTTHAPGQLGCLHGIRVMSLMWVAFGHYFLFHTAWPTTNYVSQTLAARMRWSMAPILNGYLSVDTFLLLGGILSTYVPLMDHQKGRKFIFWKYYLYRYLRITPALAAVMWYMASINNYVAHGPMWYFTVGMRKTTCQENWWPTLLYITNYVYENCIGPAWYLCVDMQLALLSPIVIIPLIKWPKYGLGILGFLTLSSMVAVFTVTYVERFPWTYVSIGGQDLARYIDVFYSNTPLRAIPYLVGMALGYILSRKTKISIPKWGIALGWLLSAAICLTIVFTILIVYAEDYVYEPVAASFYATFHKFGWAIGVGWVIWACVNGYGGPVNSILAWRYFVPFSKLSFAAYLIHQDMMDFRRALRRTANYISAFEMYYEFAAFVIVLAPFSAVLYTMVEAPIMNLLRIAFRKKSHPANAKSVDPMAKSDKDN